MSTASPVQRTKPKLAGPKKRESCDACSSQKTRCSKARPSCSRCISKGIDCVYGISRRTGRRKYRSPNASPQSTPQKDATPLAFVDDFFDPLTPLNSLNDRSRATDSFPTMDMDTPYFDFLLQPNLSCMPQSDSFSPSVGSSGTISDIDENLDLFGLPSLSPQPLQPPGQMIQAFSTAPTSAPTAKDHQAAQHNTTTEGCITTAIKLVSDLHAQQDNDLDIDFILNSNRTALRKVNQVLDCCCRTEQDVLIPTCLVVQQSMMWYEAALCAKSSDPTDNCFLDFSTQSSVHANLVLADVKQYIPPLLMKLQQRNMYTGSSPGMNLDKMASDVVECYQKMLQARFSDLVGRANSLIVV